MIKTEYNKAVRLCRLSPHFPADCPNHDFSKIFKMNRIFYRKAHNDFRKERKEKSH